MSHLYTNTHIYTDSHLHLHSYKVTQEKQQTFLASLICHPCQSSILFVRHLSRLLTLILSPCCTFEVFYCFVDLTLCSSFLSFFLSFFIPPFPSPYLITILRRMPDCYKFYLTFVTFITLLPTDCYTGTPAPPLSQTHTHLGISAFLRNFVQSRRDYLVMIWIDGVSFFSGGKR